MDSPSASLPADAERLLRIRVVVGLLTLGVLAAHTGAVVMAGIEMHVQEMNRPLRLRREGHRSVCGRLVSRGWTDSQSERSAVNIVSRALSSTNCWSASRQSLPVTDSSASKAAHPMARRLIS